VEFDNVLPAQPTVDTTRSDAAVKQPSMGTT
jgi:hypothetical protein